jgi:hypothetical protein
VVRAKDIFITAITPLIALQSAARQPKSQSACLPYEPAVVTLRGTLVRKTYPGPPNYRSVSKGDRPERSLLLDVPQPLCVKQDPVEPDLNPARTGIREVQLVLQRDQYKRSIALVGKKVAATGTLFGRHTGHHHTPVLLTVRSVQVLR